MLLFTNKFNHITAELAELRYDITFSLRDLVVRLSNVLMDFLCCNNVTRVFHVLLL